MLICPFLIIRKNTLFLVIYQVGGCKKLLPAKSLRRQKKRNGIIKKTEQERMLETKLGHHAHTLRPAPFAILILAFAEVILATDLDARCHVPEEVECAV